MKESGRTLRVSPVFSFTIFHALPQVTEHLEEAKYLDKSSKYESWWSIFDELQGEKIEIILKKWQILAKLRSDIQTLSWSCFYVCVNLMNKVKKKITLLALFSLSICSMPSLWLDI